MTPSMTESHWYLHRPDETCLHVFEARAHSPRALIVLLHGLGDHVGRHAETMRFFAERGFACVASDMRGYGKSSGRRGDIVSFEHLFDDAVCVIDAAHRRIGRSLPVVLMGHSMGGLVAVDLMQCHPDIADAFVLLSPAIRLKTKIPHWRITALKALCRIIPIIRVDAGIAAELLSSDPAVVSSYDSDPLVQRRITLRTGRELLDYSAQGTSVASKVFCPVLIVHEKGDRVCDVEGAKELFDALATTDKRILLLDGEYHEPLNDVIKHVVRNEILAWIDNVLTRLSSRDEAHPRMSYHSSRCTCRESEVTEDFSHSP